MDGKKLYEDDKVFKDVEVHIFNSVLMANKNVCRIANSITLGELKKLLAGGFTPMPGDNLLQCEMFIQYTVDGDVDFRYASFMNKTSDVKSEWCKVDPERKILIASLEDGVDYLVDFHNQKLRKENAGNTPMTVDEYVAYRRSVR